MDVHEVDGKPDAIVVIFGWLGSQLRHLHKYSQLYRDRNCSTVTGVADSYAILFGDFKILEDFCREATKATVHLLKKYPDVPVLVHVFSNGGAFPLQRLELMMEQARLSEHPSQLDKELCLLRQAIRRGGQLFDSCPAYPGPMTASRAITSSVSNQYVGAVIQVIYLVWVWMDTILLWLQGKPCRAESYWHHILDMPFAPTQGYIFSAGDHITDVIKLEELIEVRKRQALDVLILRFEDSGHVLHLRHHPTEYRAFIGNFLKKIQQHQVDATGTSEAY